MSKRSLSGRRLTGVTVTAVAVLAVATGCGGGDHSSSTGGHNTGGAPSAGASAQPGVQHSQADITFAQSMIPHHQQALEMATTAETKASRPEIKALAAEIKQAQGPEIEQMTAWLANWGAAAASMPPGETHGGGHDGGAMPGMMTAEEMAKFAAAGGAEFDRMFLEMMIEHHKGAIEMAKTEQQQGVNADAKALAATIEKDQAAEITEMQALLTSK
ncbi:hypothetical protein Sya03_60600 [Spirilliplanes yamanashiensis]|uniref:DUF305 domain-containing protein n=2 Tax=Spirilliplanes yamanashiensis TaxID=42233 RepID=A0A8J3YDN7_9ACTN|nr:hypothetical protein Sya03_60600 [Spirilliplanes yamanashiensis]